MIFVPLNCLPGCAHDAGVVRARLQQGERLGCPVTALNVVALHLARVLPVEKSASHYDLPLGLAQN